MNSFEVHIESAETTEPRQLKSKKTGETFFIRQQYAQIFMPLVKGGKPVARELKLELWNDDKAHEPGIYTVSPKFGLRYGKLEMFGFDLEPKATNQMPNLRAAQ